MAVVIDSYSESNHDTNRSLNATTTGRSQSFNARSNAVLTQAKLYLKKTGSPTGNATIKLYAHSGTYGSSSVPTGTALDSVTYDVSGLTTSYQLITFNFSGNYTLVQGTNYVLAIEYSLGDASNNIQVGTDTSSPGHGGNTAFFASGSWTADSAQDHPFYIYGTLSLTQTVTDNFDDNSINTTLWGTYTASSGSVSETSQKIQVSLAATTNGSWAGVYTKSSYDLTGSYVFMEFTAATSGNTYWDLSVNQNQIPTTNNYIAVGIDVGTGMFQAYQKISGVGSVLAEVAYDPNVHKWGRIRESGGTTFWDYSTNGLDWTNLHSASNPMAVTDVYIIIDDYEYNALSTPSAHTADNLNISPTPTAAGAKSRMTTNTFFWGF